MYAAKRRRQDSYQCELLLFYDMFLSVISFLYFVCVCVCVRALSGVPPWVLVTARVWNCNVVWIVPACVCMLFGSLGARNIWSIGTFRFLGLLRGVSPGSHPRCSYQQRPIGTFRPLGSRTAPWRVPGVSLRVLVPATACVYVCVCLEAVLETFGPSARFGP